MIHFPVPEVEALCRREQALQGEREPAAEILTLSAAKRKDLA